MGMIDESGQSSVKASILPAAVLSTTTGSSVDLQGYNSAMILITCGVWTDGTHTFTVTESADNSSFAATTAGVQVLGMPAAVLGTAGASQVYRASYVGSKQYIKILDTTSGTCNTGMLVSANVVRGMPCQVPASQ
jgi:hypothetical protein